MTLFAVNFATMAQDATEETVAVEVETVADEELEPQAEGPKVGDKIWIKSG